MRRTAPGLAVLALAVGLWLAFGVSVGDVALFVGYELVFLLAPGWLLYVALSGRRHGVLREVSVGWALGHVVEIGAFALTASLGVRAWLPLYPLAVALIAGGLILRRRRGAGVAAEIEPRLPDRWVMCVAGLLALLLVYIAAIYFAQTPLPGRAGFGGWVPDLVFELDLSGQLLHHWPLHTPELSGTSLPYESFVHMHLASVAQVTGIRLPVVLLRLYAVPMLALLVIQLSWAGRRLTGEAWSGPLAAFLLLLVGEVNPDLGNAVGSTVHPLLESLFSPTFLLGLILFVPALVLIAEVCGVAATPGAAATPSRPRREWLVLALLLAGCAGAKGAILPVVAGGLAAHLVWRLLTAHRLDLNASAALLLTVAIALASYVVLYRGASEGLHLFSHGTAAGIPGIKSLQGSFEHIAVVSALFWLIANLVIVLMFSAGPLVGLARPDTRAWPRATPLLLGMFLAGLVPFFFAFAPGYSQAWFVNYGLAAAVFVSAWGVRTLWRRRMAAPAAAAAVGSALLIYLIRPLHLGGAATHVAWVVLLAALGVALLARLKRLPQRVAAGTLVALAAFAAAQLPASTALEVAEVGPEPVNANDWGQVQSGLLSALAWVRNHTSPDAVLAVNNYWLNYAGVRQPYFLFYSALAERQVYLEGWNETMEVLGGQITATLERRRQLNDAVFQRADPRALAEMVRSAHVSYLLVDRINGHASTAIGRIATLVHSSPGVEVYAVP